MNTVSFNKYTETLKKGVLKMGHKKIMSILGLQNRLMSSCIYTNSWRWRWWHHHKDASWEIVGL